MNNFEALIIKQQNSRIENEKNLRKIAKGFIKNTLESKILEAFTTEDCNLLYLFTTTKSRVKDLIGYNRILCDELSRVGLGHRIVFTFGNGFGDYECGLDLCVRN